MMYTKTTLVEMERFDSLTVARKYRIRILKAAGFVPIKKEKDDEQ